MATSVLQRICCLIFLCILPFAFCSATAPANFNTAKKIALSVFSPHQVTLYCGCQYNNKKQVDLPSCHMDQAAAIARSHRIEWEHMMPAEHFGKYHQCWTEKICVNERTGASFRGRKCCERIDPEFKKQEAELYNLWPEVGSVNQARSNYQFAILYNKRGFYGCEFEADNALKLAEPPDRAKGIVARANLFMADKYNVELSTAQRELFLSWNKQFPPDAWELQWAEEVAYIVGYRNPYIVASIVQEAA